MSTNGPQGDVLVWDNRCLVHAATWYDAEKEQRMMWRTTVRGNPGALYAGEKRSWDPRKRWRRSSSIGLPIVMPSPVFGGGGAVIRDG